MHTLDLNGQRLTIEEYLQVWLFDSKRSLTNSNTRVAITNGVIQLGTTSRDADLRVTYLAGNTPNYYITTNNAATISVDLVATNWGNLHVGYHGANYYAGTIMEGSLDLTRSTIICEGVSNRIKCANFVVGGATRDTSCRGRLSLPPAITEIETGDFVVGGAGVGNGRGVLDLGAGAQLQRIIARTKFWYGAGGDANIAYWPGNVNLVLGTPVSAASFRIGSGGTTVAGIGAALTITNAVISGYLSDFLVGTSLAYNYGRAITGYVDLARCAIHTGAESNALHTTELRVGGMTIGMNNDSFGGKDAVLRLPPTIKTIVTGFFQLGAINGGTSYLDLGVGSQLQTFTVTNDFYLSYNGAKGYLVGLPTNGVAMTIGTPGRPVLFSQGSSRGRTYTYAGNADLVLTNVAWRAYLKNADIGMSRYSGQYDYYAVAKLDLRRSVLHAFNVADTMVVGHIFSAPNYQTYKRTIGQVYLPAGQVNIATNLVLGDRIAPSAGLLDLTGTRVAVGGKAELWSTATVNARVRGVSAGLELLSSAAGALSVSNGAVINVIFEQDPSDITRRRYSGLTAAGDQTAHFAALHANGRLAWNTAALTPRWAGRVGIRYDAKDDVTYVGFDPRMQGTLLQMR